MLTCAILAEVDRAELEALLQVKIEVSTDLREKLRAATEDIVDLRKQIHEQQEKIAHLDLVRFPPHIYQLAGWSGAHFADCWLLCFSGWS